MSKHKLIGILSFFFIFLILTSCDKFYWATIINNSSNDVTVKIKYDKNASEESKSYINSEFRDMVEIVKLKPTEEYTFKGNIRIKPNFEAIEEIEIFSNDTLILKSERFFLDKLFSTDQEKGIYELEIK